MSMTPMKTALAGLCVAVIAGCSAAPAPCLVARPGVGGYGVLLVRQGAAPAGCTDLPLSAFQIDQSVGGAQLISVPFTAGSPAVWWDGWRTDLFAAPNAPSGSQLALWSDRMSLTAPYSTVVRADWPSTPNSKNECSLANVPVLTDPTADPLGAGDPEQTLTYKINSITFLDGVKYQGLQFTADVDATFGSCTAKYTALGLAPSAFEGYLNLPAAACRTDADCSPDPDLSANPPRSLGSGYNPDFKVVCRTDIGRALQYGPPLACAVALAEDGTCPQPVNQYCLSVEDDGSCLPENLDPDTRQEGVCFPADQTFPALR